MRVLLFANDGLGAGHLTRTLAIARALRRRRPDVELLLATTSEADALLAAEPVAAVRWPTPASARQSGWCDAERRDVAARIVRASIEGFRPDVLVTDTFPSGPHGELAGLLRMVPRRVLVRRSIRPERTREPAVSAGLAEYDLAIVPDDPGEQVAEGLPMPVVRVPPITLFEADEALDRRQARQRLGLPRQGKVILVCSGGGGDPEARARALDTAASVRSLPRGPTPVLAMGPLARDAPDSTFRCIHETPLQPLLAAFDGAIAPAGYNLAHEIAKAGVPLALFAMERPFDDQAARAARFEDAGLARSLARTGAREIGEAVAWMRQAPQKKLAAGGADRAAEALLTMVARGAA